MAELTYNKEQLSSVGNESNYQGNSLSQRTTTATNVSIVKVTPVSNIMKKETWQSDVNVNILTSIPLNNSKPDKPLSVLLTVNQPGIKLD